MTDVKNFALNKTKKLLDQVAEIAASPAYVDQKIRIMPDAHAGKGSCVGFTSTFSDKICPNTVGVDIGCRISLFETPWFLEDMTDLDKFDKKVRSVIPTGRNIHNHSVSSFDYNELMCWDYISNHQRIINSQGTLGGGNHYIELDVDDNGRVYLVIHSGSRNLGVQVCNFYQKIAVEKSKSKGNLLKTMREAVISYGKETHQEQLISQMLDMLHGIQIEKYALESDLAYIEGNDLDDYLNDMLVCANWSLVSHIAMANMLIGYYNYSIVATSLHNYVDVDNHIVRKGAIDCTNARCLVPLNMRDGLLIIEGCENEDWNNSLPHGAGRVMSRTAAHLLLQIESYKASMNGIYSSCVTESTLDEAPNTYNSSKALEELLTRNGFVITEQLTPIYNFKAV